MAPPADPPDPQAALSGAHGNVYVMQDRTEPRLLKVGVTTRRASERQAEIVRTMTAGAPLRQLRHHGERGREWYRAATPAKLKRTLTEVEHAARDVKRLAQRQGAWSQEDEDDAYRWRLTSSGPIRTPFFRPKTAAAFGQSAAPAAPNQP